MKILLFTDLHMCSKASIINKWGNKYFTRLENCIKSMNWVEQTAKDQGCSMVINLGDFFDRPDLTSDVITACNEIIWYEIDHLSLVGNHDASNRSLELNSVNRLATAFHRIVDKPEVIELPDCNLCLLPYVLECDRAPLIEYFPKINKDLPTIILSHNDLNGIQLGPIVSKTGFTLDEIEATCDLFINGHLHNGQKITEKVINLGNLTGKDFGENAFKYSHNVVILDTSTQELTYIENPFALNFYKLDIPTAQVIEQLDTVKPNAVVSIRCEKSLLNAIKEKIDKNDNIIESRIIVTQTQEVSETNPTLELSVDHIARFVECCKLHIENSTLLDEELQEICK